MSSSSLGSWVSTPKDTISRYSKLCLVFPCRVRSPWERCVLCRPIGSVWWSVVWWSFLSNVSMSRGTDQWRLQRPRRTSEKESAGVLSAFFSAALFFPLFRENIRRNRALPREHTHFLANQWILFWNFSMCSQRNEHYFHLPYVRGALSLTCESVEEAPLSPWISYFSQFLSREGPPQKSYPTNTWARRTLVPFREVKALHNSE